MQISRTIPTVALLMVLVTVGGCIVRARSVEVAELTTRGTRVTTPFKAHLKDGSAMIFLNGAHVSQDSVIGWGDLYSADQRSLGKRNGVKLDSVAGLTNYWNGTKATESVLLTMAGTVAGFFATSAALVALFGSCPTFYTDTDGVAGLEAEGFSYSIAPLFESRDLDALRGRPRNGVFTIEMRNEALETHFINHLELLAFEHPHGMRVLPDGRGNLTAIGVQQAARRAVDRSGRDVAGILRSADDQLFESADARLHSATSSDLMDYVDVDFGIARSDSAAVTVRLRNSLLTTVLLYDVMLGSAGAGALDWLAHDLQQVGTAAELGKWYVERMGLRVLVKTETGYVEAGRIPDVGPIAWKDVAVMVPARKGERLLVRIEFPTDSWRIDKLSIAFDARSVAPRTLTPARVRHPEGALDARSLNAITSADEAYLITEPGRRVFIDFDVPSASPGHTQSFILASQGYYNEWIRPAWAQRATTSRFDASDASLFQALQQWRERRTELEHAFYSTKIPVQ